MSKKKSRLWAVGHCHHLWLSSSHKSSSSSFKTWASFAYAPMADLALGVSLAFFVSVGCSPSKSFHNFSTVARSGYLPTTEYESGKRLNCVWYTNFPFSYLVSLNAFTCQYAPSTLGSVDLFSLSSMKKNDLLLSDGSLTYTSTYWMDRNLSIFSSWNLQSFCGLDLRHFGNDSTDSVAYLKTDHITWFNFLHNSSSFRLVIKRWTRLDRKVNILCLISQHAQSWLHFLAPKLWSLLVVRDWVRRPWFVLCEWWSSGDHYRIKG